MSALDDVVSVVITANTASPSKEGFGTPLIAGYFPTSIGTARVRTYAKPSEMLTDGFVVTDQLYKAAVILCSQPNKPKNFKIGRCVGAPTHTVTLKCTSAVQGDVYSVDWLADDGTSGTKTYTVVGSETTTTVATALELLIEAIPDVASTSSTDTITAVTSTNGKVTTYSNWTSNIQFTDTTADPATSLATDLAAIAAEDNDWYGLLLANECETMQNLAAAYALTNKKLFGYATSDYGVTQAGTTTDIMSDLKGLSNDHAFGIFNGKKSPSYAAAAWMGNRFPYLPGGSTWQFKTLAGVPVDSLTTSVKNAIIGKNGSYYITLASINCALGGAKVASGEYIDVIHFLDWLKAEIQFRVFSLLINNDKVPYTDTGISVVMSAVQSALQAGVDAKGLSPNPAPVVTVPKAAAVSASDKATRTLNNVTFTCTLAGAIHTANVSGTVSV